MRLMRHLLFLTAIAGIMIVVDAVHSGGKRPAGRLRPPAVDLP
jgi:hypothetical protein